MCVQDLTEASQLQPEDEEIKRQLEKAKEDLEESRALKKLQALKSGKSDADVSVSKEQLKLIETLSQTLKLKTESHGPHVPMLCYSNISRKGLGGAALPTRSVVHKVPSRHDEVVKAAQSLRCEITSHKDLQLYLRACGGLVSAADHLCYAAGIAAPGVVVDDMKSATAPQRECVAAACAALLNEACQNSANILLIAGCIRPDQPARLDGGLFSGRQVLDALCRMLDGTAGSACATLLYTLSTDVDSRKQVSSALASCDSTDLTSPGAKRLLRGLEGATVAHQAHALMLLSNCILSKDLRNALQDDGAFMQQLSLMLEQAKHDLIIEKAAALLGNTINDALWRSQAVVCPAIIPTLTKLARTPSLAEPALQACITCLYNLAIEDTLHVALLQPEWLKACNGLLRHGNHTVVVRIAGILSRVARAPGAIELMIDLGTADALKDAACASLVSCGTLSENSRVQADWLKLCREHPNLQAAWKPVDAWSLTDSYVRALAIWGGPKTDSAPGTLLLKTSAVQTLLLLCCSCKDGTPGAAGNAALCLSYVADSKCVHAFHIPL